MRKASSVLLAAALLSATFVAQARDGDAIIGSILGGATGAVIGNNVGGRDGAIIGGAIGAAAGVAIATDHQRNSGYDHHGYRSVRRDHDGHRYDSRYDSHYDRNYQRSREVIVVESPRHYYRGNEFVYGVPHHDDGHHRYYRDHPGRGRGHRHGHRHHHDGYDRGGNVVIIQSSPRRW